MTRTMRSATWAGVLGATILMTSPARAGDERATVIKKADEALEAEASRYRADGKFTSKVGVDWAGVQDLKDATQIAERCGGIVHGLAHLCTSEETHRPVDACAAYVSETAISCAVGNAGEPRIEARGKSLVYHLGGTSPGRDTLVGLLAPHFPRRALLVLMHDADAYLGKDEHAKHTPVTVDAESFAAAGRGLGGNGGVATYCSHAFRFIEMLNGAECELSSCRGDAKKKASFREGAKQVRCVFTKVATAPEKKGDTIVFPVGDWAVRNGSLDGIAFAVFHELRKKLKIRDCGVDMRYADPRGGGGVMGGWARQECCAKDGGGKCLPHAYEPKPIEVCEQLGLGAEKKCHGREVLKATLQKTAR